MKRYDSEFMATLWANKYHEAASAVTDEWGNSVMGTHPDTFKSMLKTAFDKSSTGTLESPIDVRPDIASALSSYWSGATLGIAGMPAGGISGILNVVSGTVSNFNCNIDIDPAKSIDEGADVLSKQLQSSTQQVATTLTYLKSGSPPTVEVVNSTLR